MARRAGPRRAATAPRPPAGRAKSLPPFVKTSRSDIDRHRTIGYSNSTVTLGASRTRPPSREGTPRGAIRAVRFVIPLLPTLFSTAEAGPDDTPKVGSQVVVLPWAAAKPGEPRLVSDGEHFHF